MRDLKIRFTDFIAILQHLDSGFLSDVERVAELLTSHAASGGTVLVFGNGGSAADASHFAAEFVGRFLKERRALPAISLSAESSSITALGNDYGYEHVFERQVEAFGKPGDVAIGITTSGRSLNVLKALAAARARGLATVALTGAAGLAGANESTDRAVPAADIVLAVPSTITYEIQEVHMMVLHSLCEIVEASL